MHRTRPAEPNLLIITYPFPPDTSLTWTRSVHSSLFPDMYAFATCMARWVCKFESFVAGVFTVCFTYVQAETLLPSTDGSRSNTAPPVLQTHANCHLQCPPGGTDTVSGFHIAYCQRAFRKEISNSGVPRRVVWCVQTPPEILKISVESSIA